MPSLGAASAARAVHPSPTPSISHQFDEANLRNNARHIHWGAEEVFEDDAKAESEGADGTEVEEEQLSDGLVLAITAAKSKVACCYFDPASDKIFFLEDQQDSPEWDLTALALEQLAPKFVLTCANADADFLQAVEEKLSSLAPDSSNASSLGPDGTPVRIEYRPNRDFYAGSGKNALYRVHITEGGWYAPAEEEAVGSDSGSTHDQQDSNDFALGDAYDFGRPRAKRRKVAHNQDDRARRNSELRIETFLSSLNACPLTLGCAGALLGYITRQRTEAGELENDLFEVSGLELMRLDKVMHINSDALTSLQIFCEESHASAHSRSTKEGLSLFGIVNIAHTPLGRALMRQWFLRPSLELDVIESRQAAVECFLRESNQHIVDAICKHLRNVKNTPRQLKALASGKSTIKEWQAAWSLIYAAIMIRDATSQLVHKTGVEVIDKLAAAYDVAQIKEIADMINDIIDWEESARQNGKVCVRPGVDATLDELRRKYNGLGSLLSKVAVEISQEVPPGLAGELSVVYFPQLGYLITIAYEPEVTDAGKYGQFGWDFQFVTEMQAYFKNEKCRDMDRHLGDLQSFISDKEIEIIHALLSHVLAIRDQLIASVAIFSELDCLIAFAEAAKLYNWTRPVMTEEPVCKILKGRHPLSELCVDTFVPNNTSLTGGLGIKRSPDGVDEKPDLQEISQDEKSVIIVTGANFSGKSVYLKQIALITFMAHIGCFVPAEDALIGLTDRIMTRVSTKESITRGSSAFMIDLQQISFALRNLTLRSLLIIDEFGKGTEPDDGAGLFCGVVDHLVGLGSGTPRVAIATHFQHVFTNGLLSRQLPIFLAHMEVLVVEPSPDGRERDERRGAGREFDELTYLYRLAPGLSLSSHALSCSSLFGIPPSLLSRAAAITHALSTFSLDSLTLGDEMGKDERSELCEAERVARRFVGWDVPAEGKEEMGAEEVRALVRSLLDVEG
ncbi:RHTO0S09e00958g1_1 [Rhodotorula toruloides]|uniref:RHTO0S09e00958g1_1 n=1 Tax=Rhodotorula toruloides TaxID=5286 RepID=A0A061B8G8_RHOTO|nr:RHTO0S09e00958g1_1 [Rhodotorula toruloides]